MFFLAPALPYMGAGIAGLAAAARGLGSPQGQRVVQGGLNTISKFGDKIPSFMRGLQNYAGFNTNLAPQGNIMSKINPGRIGSAAVPSFSMQYATDPEAAKYDLKDTLEMSDMLAEVTTDPLIEKILNLFDKKDKKGK